MEQQYMNDKNCPKCGSKIFHNKGISKKTGKPYENYKCGGCDYIRWVDLTGEGQGFKKAVPANNEALNELKEEIKGLRKDFKLFTDSFAGDNQELKDFAQDDRRYQESL